MGRPWLGASLRRTFRGMAVLYTLPGKKRLTSSVTWRARLVRLSYMVMSTPSSSRAGFRDRRTALMVYIRSLSPSRAKYSLCTGTRAASAAHRPLRVNSSREGGQSTNM